MVARTDTGQGRLVDWTRVRETGPYVCGRRAGAGGGSHVRSREGGGERLNLNWLTDLSIKLCCFNFRFEHQRI